MHLRWIAPPLLCLSVTVVAIFAPGRGGSRKGAAPAFAASAAREQGQRRPPKPPARKASPAPKPRPAIRIATVRTGSGGTANGDQLPFCSTDRLRAEATTSGDDGLKVKWQAQPTDGRVAGATGGRGKTFDFRLTDLTPWEDPYEARYPLSLVVTAALVDGHGKQVASDTRWVVQSDLGQLRQEYVDHPLLPPAGAKRVPEVDDFRAMPRDGTWNDGDYDWALVPDWALAAEASVQQDAGARRLFADGGGPVVTSVFRSPARHWRLYLDLGRRVTPGSRHLWGLAVDFGVGDADGDAQWQTWSDWGAMRDVCNDYGMVVNEGRTDHVHLQWTPG